LPKAVTFFECEACGARSPKWMGKCSSCGAWDTFVEVKPAKTIQGRSTLSEKSQKLAEITSHDFVRTDTGLSEFDRILGGGIVEGATILLGGDPGVGKSTLLLQALGLLGKKSQVLYVSAEESAAQIGSRAKRLGITAEGLGILSTTSLENIFDEITEVKPESVVIDSIQTIFSEKIPAAPGSLAQIRECAFTLTQYAKNNMVSIFLVGHITKEGLIAGPKALEHIVDVVLYLEGENYRNLKVLRAQKNRFGTINEIALFDMTEEGLKEVKNPSEVLLKDRLLGEPGSSIGVSIEGTTPLLFEIQALLSPSAFGYAKRMSVGFDRNRMQLLTAVIERIAKLTLGDKDLFVNVVGGVPVNDPGLDLPLSISVLSSLKGKPLSEETVSFGEVGLLGEVRSTSYPLKRIKEAQALGFKTVVLPKSDFERVDFKEKGIKLKPVSSLKEAFQLFFG
jgi:DNA repair protein RadA/Sms